LIARTGRIHWIGRGRLQGLTDRFAPPAQIGPFPLNWLIEQPDWIRFLPVAVKKMIASRGLRPSAASWLYSRTERLRMRMGRVVLSASPVRDQVLLKMDDRSQLTVDHVLMATGYRPDLTKYPFLPADLVSRMASADRYPVLSGGLESSIPGLYFAGAAAVPSLGPYMRFVAGSGFAARRVAGQVARRARRNASSPQIFLPAEVKAEVPAPVAKISEVTSLTSVPRVIENANDRL